MSAPIVEIFVELVGDSISYNMEDSLPTYANDSVKLTLLVRMPSSGAPAKIHVKAGTSQGGGQILEKSFVYDGLADQGGGTSYKRTGKYVYLGLGEYFGIAKVHVQVWLEDGSNNLSGITEATAGY